MDIALYLPWRAPILFIPSAAIAVICTGSLKGPIDRHLARATILASLASLLGFFYVATEQLEVIRDGSFFGVPIYLAFALVCGGGPVAVAGLLVGRARKKVGRGNAALASAVIAWVLCPFLLSYWSNHFPP